MTARDVLNSALLVVATTLTVPGATASVSQDSSTAARSIRNQFVIALPEGWSVYEQNEALSGTPSTVGMVIFSAQRLTREGTATADGELLSKVDSGELASFFVDRVPADKGMSCDKLSRSAIYSIGTKLNQDPAVRTFGRRFLEYRPPAHKDIELGGCRGVRFVIEAHKHDPAKHSIVDVRAVSDGKVLYLFSLRNKGTYYAQNVEIFETAMASVRFTLAK